MTEKELLNANSEGRTKCLIYTRVMGYHRPVESFNTGKKGEHKQRVHFREFNRTGSAGFVQPAPGDKASVSAAAKS